MMKMPHETMLNALMVYAFYCEKKEKTEKDMEKMKTILEKEKCIQMIDELNQKNIIIIC